MQLAPFGPSIAAELTALNDVETRSCEPIEVVTYTNEGDGRFRLGWVGVIVRSGAKLEDLPASRDSKGPFC